MGGELPDKLAFTVCASDTVGRDPISGKLDVTDINNDCQVRVATTYTLMAEACPDIAFVEANCLAAAVPARFEQACPQEGQIAECPKEEVLPDCSNFDPEQPKPSDATLPPGGINRGDEPVCFVASTATAASDFTAAPGLPTTVPTPMAAGLFGQRSTCVLDPELSIATVTLDGEMREPSVSGVVEFLGAPCPGAACAVGMTYQLDLAPFSFAGFCAGTEITDVRTVGTAAAGAVVLDAERRRPNRRRADAHLGARHPQGFRVLHHRPGTPDVLRGDECGSHRRHRGLGCQDLHRERRHRRHGRE